MLKVFCVTRDSRLGFQLRRWLTDLIDDFEWTCVASLEDLRLPARPPSAPENQLPDSTSDPEVKSDPVSLSPSPAATSSELPPPSASSDPNSINPYLILVDDLTQVQIQARELLEIKMRFSIPGAEQGQPVVLVIAPDDPGHPSEMYKATGCDDLIRKPVDRSIFLQKIEIMLARGKSISPTFLFKLKTKFDVDIGKDCVLEAISETECLVRNPRALHPEAHVTLYASVFGAGMNEKVEARVLDSWAHPSVKGEFLIRLRLFGLSDQQIRSIRIFAKSQGVKILKPGTRRPSAEIEEALNEADKFRASRRATFAIIDFDELTARTLQSSLKDVADIEIKSFKGLARFLHAIAPPPAKPAEPVVQVVAEKQLIHETEKSADATADGTGEQSDQAKAAVASPEIGIQRVLPTTSVSLVIAGGSGRLIRFESDLAQEDVFLGLTVREWAVGERTLSERFHQTETQALQEFLGWVLARGRGEIRLQFKGSDSSITTLDIKAEKWRQAEDSDESVIHLEVSLASVDTDATASEQRLQVIDAILVEATFLGANTSAMLSTIKKSMTEAGIVNSFGHVPPLIVMADPAEKISPHAYRSPDITHFVYKTVDRRFYVQTFFSLARREFWKMNVQPEPLLTCQIVGQLARESHLEEIAEYGFVIKEAFPFRIGIFLRLFSPILGETGFGALGRCISTRELSDKQWESDFVFFGSSDGLQKQIRNYILEDHIDKKKASGESP